MRITEKHVNDSHLEEVYQLLQRGESVIGIDMEDVKNVLVGKECILYEAYKDDGVENGAFLKEFFNTLRKMESVQNCTGLLFNIVMPKDDQLVMDDMEYVRYFLWLFEDKDLKIQWGLRASEAETRTRVQTICTKQ
jgi:cell division GTPase FtsZ